MRSSVEKSINNSFMVKSASDNTKYHTVYFGVNVNFCSCSCKEFRKARILCKHIIIVVSVAKKTFTDLNFISGTSAYKSGRRFVPKFSRE